jgi:hypothetical protein
VTSTLPVLRRPCATLAAIAVLAGLAPGQAGTYTTYRSSCPGAAGTPQLAGAAPVIGRSWSLTIQGLLPGAAGSLFFAVRDDFVGAAALPLDLAGVGAPGCFLNVNSDPTAGAGAASMNADSFGSASFVLVVPQAAALLGATFFNQYVSLEAPPGRSLPITTTNAGRGVVGTFGLADMEPIPAGSFAMGSTRGAPSERPVHTVQITRPFWMGRNEVSQDEWRAVMGTNPSYHWGGTRPVEMVSWQDALAYCAALNAREGAAGRLPVGYHYRLPTEAEWEYGCRAGTTTEWNVGPSLACADANFRGASGSTPCVGGTSPVGSYRPNAFGLHDMHGNVAEWCLDAWDGGSANYPPGPIADPFVRVGAHRILPAAA